MGLLLILASTLWSNVKKISAAEERAEIVVEQTTDENRLMVTLSLLEPEAGEYLLTYEGIEELTTEEIEQGVSEELKDQIHISEIEDGVSKVVIETELPRVELTFNVQKKETAENASLKLADSSDEVLLEQVLFTKSESSENFTDPFAIGSRAWTGANAFPEDTIPLTDVFNSPIGTGPNLLDSGRVLQITGGNSQTGAIWSKRKVNLLNDFTFTSFIYLGNGKNGTTTSNGDVADGITMTFQNDSRMTTDPTSVVGPGGGALGAYSTSSGDSSRYIRNAISLEFDPFNNGSIDTAVSGNGGHIAVMVPAGRNDQAAYRTHHGLLTTSSLSATDADRMSNDTWRSLTIHWQASTKTLYYNVEGFGNGQYTVSDLNATFGGTSAYWGFTGATGTLMMDSRIAMKEIPGVATHNLRLRNETRSMVAGTYTEGFKGDTISIADLLSPDDDAILSGDGATVKITLPEGLTYSSGTMAIDGVAIPDENMNFSGQTIEIPNLNLTGKTLNDIYVLNFRAVVTTDAVDVSLPTVISAYSKYGTPWGTSNEGIVYIPDHGTVNFHYVDEDGEEIAESDSVMERVGNAFSGTPKDIQYYTYDRTVGIANGLMTTGSKDVYFYYKRDTAKITAAFIDEDDQLICESIVKTHPVGTTINLNDDTDIQAAIAELLANNYVLLERPTDETNLEIPAEGKTVNYVFKYVGSLSIASAPDVLNFGTETNDVLTRVDSPEYDNELIISDSRAQRTKWRLVVELTKPLTHDEDTSKVIDEAIRYKRGSTEYKLSEGPVEIHEELSGNSGTFTLSNDWSAAGDGFKLEVPAGNVYKLGTYQAEMLWKLTDAY